MNNNSLLNFRGVVFTHKRTHLSAVRISQWNYPTPHIELSLFKRQSGDDDNGKIIYHKIISVNNAKGLIKKLQEYSYSNNFELFTIDL